MQCPACGVDVVQDAIFCHKCGRRIDAPDEGSPDLPADKPEPAAVPAEPADALRDPAARHELQDEPERELWRGGYSSKAMIGGWVISGLATLLLLFLGALWVRQAVWWLVLVAAILLVWLYHVVILCYRKMSVRYVLTTQKFVHESGLLRRVTNRIEALDMDDITFEQGPLERLAGVGTIRIVSSDRSDPNFALLGIENARRVAEQFDDVRRAERRRHGLHIEQI